MDSNNPSAAENGSAAFVDYRQLESALGKASVEINNINFTSIKKLYRLNKSIPRITEELYLLNESVFGKATANPQYNLLAASYYDLKRTIEESPIGLDEVLASQDGLVVLNAGPLFDFRGLQCAMGETSLRLRELDPDAISKISKLNLAVTDVNKELIKLNEEAAASVPRATSAEARIIATRADNIAEETRTADTVALFNTLEMVAEKKETKVASEERFGSAKNLKGVGISLSVIGGVGLAQIGLKGITDTAIGIGMGFAGAGLAFCVSGLIFLVISGCFACLLVKGIGTLSLASSFDAFKRIIGDRDTCSIAELSAKSGMSQKRVIAKVQEILQRGLFPRGYIDDTGTILTLTEESYRRYCQKVAENARAKEAKAQLTSADSAHDALPAEARRFIRTGQDHIERMQALDVAIADEAVSVRIVSISQIVDRLLNRVQAEPSTVDSLDKLLDYYLPTTIKLLEAYDDLEKEPVQGQNIAGLREEIEEALDVLDRAYQKLLDESYQDASLEVSSDISVLNAVLAQEGLVGTPFDETSERADDIANR